MSTAPDVATWQVVVETMSFAGLAISFDARVLRPRPWTAAQSAWAAELCRDAAPGPVLELCSGAGHIGLLAARMSGRALVCVDVDPVAAAYCVGNAAANDLADQVEMRTSALETAVPPDETYAVILADPPWVPTSGTSRFPEDPLLAIDGGDDGLDVAHRCVEVVADHLAPGGAAVLQLGTAAQAEAVVAAAAGRVHLAELRSFEPNGVLALLRLGPDPRHDRP